MNYEPIIPKGMGKAIEVKIPSNDSFGKNTINGKPMFGLQHGSLKGLSILANPVNDINKGGKRGVLPCQPVPFYKNTIRPSAIPNANSYQVNQGFARHQPKGLAYQEEYPTDNPFLRMPNVFDASVSSKLPYPK